MTGRNPTSFDEGPQSQSSCAGVSELPSCLIPYILVKLPIKIIIRCKCVSKNWNHLILDPYFTKLYSKSSQFTAIVLLQYAKSSSNPSPRDAAFRFLEIGNSVDDVISTPFNLDSLILTLGSVKEEKFERRLVGSVNGFLFVVLTLYLVVHDHLKFKSESFFVINPLTGESVVIPRVKGAEETCRDSYGFGSTVDGDYYKVVRIVEIYDENHQLMLDLKIITVGVDDEWRDFDDPAIIDVFVSDGVALNGALHWVHHKSDYNSIYAFDIGKEVGLRIPGPSSNILGGYLGVWDAHLCFTQDNTNGLQFDVWTMRQYGVAESWTKDIILRSSILSPDIYPAAIPKTTRRNRDLLLSVVSYEGHKSLISFDPKTKNCVKLEEVYDDDKDTDSDLLKYAPCFSSLSGMISRQITIRD